MSENGRSVYQDYDNCSCALQPVYQQSGSGVYYGQNAATNLISQTTSRVPHTSKIRSHQQHHYESETVVKYETDASTAKQETNESANKAQRFVLTERRYQNKKTSTRTSGELG
uniref:Uncharacterized protein n=1 Tax=Cacopsylla melanoneura TaxID=428564 RepID=A0A8D8ZIM1_9HEMI